MYLQLYDHHSFLWRKYQLAQAASLIAYYEENLLIITIIKFILTPVFHACMGWTISYKRLPRISVFSYVYCLKCVRIQSFPGPYFPVFRLNFEIYRVNIRIQSTGKYGLEKLQKRRFLCCGSCWLSSLSDHFWLTCSVFSLVVLWGNYR